MATVVTCPRCGAESRLRPSAAGRPRCRACREPLPWIVAASDPNDFDAEADAALPVVVDLWAPWCAPCRAVAPVLEAFARDNAGRVKLVKVNVDETPALARRFDARSIPTILVLSRGRQIERIVGAPPAADLRLRLARHLGPAPAPQESAAGGGR